MTELPVQYEQDAQKIAACSALVLLTGAESLRVGVACLGWRSQLTVEAPGVARATRCQVALTCQRQTAADYDHRTAPEHASYRSPGLELGTRPSPGRELEEEQERDIGCDPVHDTSAHARYLG
jgi:hypothetical protein